MATANTNLYSGQTSTIHAALPTGTATNGVVRYAIATYTCLGTENATDSINVCKVPVGSIIRAGLSRVSSEACGGTAGTILTIGDTVTADRYSATALAITAAGTNAVTPVAANEVDRVPVTADTNTVTAVFGGFTGSTHPTAGKKIVFEIAYQLP